MTLMTGDRVRYIGSDEDYECSVGTVAAVGDPLVAVALDFGRGEEVFPVSDLEKVSGRLVNEKWNPARWPVDTRDGVADAGAQGSGPAVADAGAAAHLKRQQDKREAVQQYRDEHRGVEPELPFDEVHGECPPLDATPIPPAVTHGYVTKDSGERAEYSTGMVRDTQTGKPRFDLIVPRGVPYTENMLTRWAALMTRGAEKYGDRNWENARTTEEMERFLASATRHFMQWVLGEQDEDHAAAVMFNITAYETTMYMASTATNIFDD